MSALTVNSHASIADAHFSSEGYIEMYKFFMMLMEVVELSQDV